MTSTLKLYLSSDGHFGSDMSSDGIEGLGHLSFDGLGGATDSENLSNGL